jgi:phage shock protein PspC (stress-responsive transcriptional regulator)
MSILQNRNKWMNINNLKNKAMKKLVRSNEKLVAGVIGGISNYINPELDPVLLRIVFAWFAFFNPALILIYFVLAMVLPKEDPQFAQ